MTFADYNAYRIANILLPESRSLYNPPSASVDCRNPSPDMAPHSTSSDSSSPSSSPRAATASPAPLSPAALPPEQITRRRSSGWKSTTFSPIPEDDVLYSEPPTSIEDCSRLLDLNLDLKSTLTDLLNCDAVKSDSRMRMWVQSRLMDAELELKRQRKRRISSSSFVSTASSTQ